MPSLIRPTLLTLMLLALLGACGEEAGTDHDQLVRSFVAQEPQGVPAEFRALLPDDTLLYMQARSVEALAADLTALNGESLPGPPSRGAMLSVVSMFSPAGALRVEDVATEQPLGFALHWPAGAREPQLMTLFFRADDADFEARLGDQFSLVREGQAVRAMLRGDDDALAPSSGAAPLPEQLAVGQLSLWVDLQTTFEHPGVRAAYEAGVAMMVMAMSAQQANAPDLSPMRDVIDLELALFRESFDELKRLDLGARVVDGVFQVHGDLELREGSALGDFSAGDMSDLPRVAAKIADDSPVWALSHADYAQLRARSAPLLQRLAQRDELLAEKLGELLGFAAAFGGTQALEMRDVGEMQMRSFLARSGTDGVEQIVEAVSSVGTMFGGVTYTAPERREIDGVGVSTVRVDDLGVLTASMPDNPMFDALSQQTTSFFEHEGLLVMVQGRDVDREVRAAIAALDADDTLPAGMQSTLERFEGTGAAFALRMRMGTLLRALAANMGGPPPPGDGDPALSMFLANKGAHWSLDVTLDAEGLARMMGG